MKTRATLDKEKRKKEAESKALAKLVRQASQKPTAGTSGEAMDTTEIVTVVPPSVVVPPSTSALPPAGIKASKRTIEKVIDPDNGKDTPESKRSNVPLDKGIKRLCLKSVLEFFRWLSDEAAKIIHDQECRYNLNVSNALVSIIFTTHNILRQKQNSNTRSNMQNKSVATDFTICFKGQTYTISRANSEKAWKEILSKNGLKYDVDKDSEGN